MLREDGVLFLEGVFSVAAQHDITDSHCRHVPFVARLQRKYQKAVAMLLRFIFRF